MINMDIEYRRILLKLSGEALCGDKQFGVDKRTVELLAKQIAMVTEMGKQAACVIGAGNIFRGVEGMAMNMDQVTSDQIGMIATLMNSLIMHEVLKNEGVSSVVFSALGMKSIAEPYNPLKARRVLEEGKIAICAGGTGNPYFTTDTAAVLRALELKCDAIFKGTKVDGVFDRDPMKHSDAKKFDKISYKDVLKLQLGIMDLTAIALAQVNRLPIVVYNMTKYGELARIIGGEMTNATIIHD